MSRTNLSENGSLYLSGGMQFADNLGYSWRESCSTEVSKLGFFPLNITVLDMMYTKDHGELYRTLGDSDILQRKSNIRKHFIETDLSLIRNDTDGVIVYYDESVRLGAGTHSEAHEAFMLDIPVFLVNSYADLSDVPGWLQAETTRIFATFDELYQYLAALPAGILKRDIYGNRRSGSFYLCSLCGEVEEKHKAHFVSKISPQYCRRCVDLVKTTFESHQDRYQYFINVLEQIEHERNEYALYQSKTTGNP